MNTKDRKREAAPVPMVSAGKHGRLQEAALVPMVGAGKHGRLEEAMVLGSGA